MMRWFKATVAYDGTNYAGWQRQNGQPTIQECLEKALTQITGEAVAVAGSGRTDAGVHALGQVASFQTSADMTIEVLQRAANAVLPTDIAVLSLEQVSSGFHARRDAVHKRYRYRILNGPVRDVFQAPYTWHVARPLDSAAMQRSAQGLAGRHDFRSFEASGAPRQSSVRTVTHLCVDRHEGSPGPWVVIEVQANGFLYRMVRNIVGSLVEVGRGSKPEGWPTEVLRAQDRQLAGPTAPAQGLFLVEVHYK